MAKPLVKICPKCGVSCKYTVTAIQQTFGWTQDVMSPNKKPQSWCRQCRSAQAVTLKVKKAYAKKFPGDNQKRSVATMRSRLAKAANE